MSALVEALLAAQRQAIATLEKQYVAGTMEVQPFCEWLDAMGCKDVLEQGQLLAALNALKQFGTASPAASRASDAPKMISDGQKPYIRDLFRKKNIEPLDDVDLNALTYAKASALNEAKATAAEQLGATLRRYVSLDPECSGWEVNASVVVE